MTHRYRLPFHDAIVAELRQRESQSWQWFAQQVLGEEHRQAQVTAILKRNARLKEGTAPELEQALEIAREKLQETRPVSLYRTLGRIEPNASIVVHPDRLHIALAGNIESLLDATELTALFGHELAHAALWAEDGGELLIADQLLGAWSHQSGASVWQETSRRFQLLNELACDRVALQVTESLEATVSCLVKVSTGNSQCNGADYLQQASEIFEREGGWAGQMGSEGWTHPEHHLRALALLWWSQRGTEAEDDIQRLVEGRSDLTRMTLLDQRRWTDWTVQLVRHILSPAWRATETSVNHARLFAPSLPESGPIRATEPLESLANALEFSGAELRDYACYLLLDFATCDPSLGDLAIAQAIFLGQQLKVEERLSELLHRDLKLRKRQIVSLTRKAEELIAEAADRIAATDLNTGDEGDAS